MDPAPSFQLVVDGKPCTARAGQTLLEVAKAAGIAIPTLCHDPRLPPAGACLLCVVEVEGARRLQLSCATQAAEGMVVYTRSPKVVASRRQTLELLVSNHHADCRGECYARCPASVDVQGYLALAHAGRTEEALALVREKNPLPSVCGRVCVRYCEATCRRKTLDEPVGANLVKRYLADAALEPPAQAPVPWSGRRVAIVGGGPAGLTAAYFLARRGHRVRIHDAHEKLGGTLRYGIPDYRLPPEALDRDIGHVLDHGVEVRMGVRLGRDFTLESLKADGHDAILLALGAMKAKPLGVAGEATAGVHGGLDFLAKVKEEGPPALSGTVLTVGGGNTAIDAARTALRCGAERSIIVYRRTREEMPADPGEIEDALAEGVTLELLVAPLEVVARDGRARALRCQRMRLGEPDASGRRKPVPIEGALVELPCDTVIAAIGQDVDLGGTGGVAASRWKTLQVDPATHATDLPGVFAAGDAVSGPRAAVDAIGAGRRAAESIDRFLANGVLSPEPKEFLSKRSNLVEPRADGDEDVPRSRRAEPRKDAPAQRARSWGELDHGLEGAQARAEAGRCLSCGCSAVFTCLLKRYAGEYGVDQARLKGRVKKFKVDARHPLIAFDANKCVLCGKCVRLCADLLKVPALGFVHRGFDTMMRPSMERALQDTTCVACGNCLETCPTAAIHARSALEKPGPWRAEKHPSVCSVCGVGCALTFDQTDDRIWQVSSRPPPGWDEGLLCARGRFGHRYLRDAERLASARSGRGAAQRDTGLALAIAQAEEGLRVVRQRFGAGALAFLVSPRATNEEIFLAKTLANDVFGCRNVATLADVSRGRRSAALDDVLGRTASTLKVRDLEGADLVVLVNADPVEDNPVAGFALHRAVERGAEVWCLAGTETRTCALATRRLEVRRGTSAVLLRALASEVVRLGGLDERFGAERTDGLAAFVAALPDGLAEAERLSGVAAGDVRSLARKLADPRLRVAFVYDADGDADWAEGDLREIAHLLLLTGRFGRAGSGLLLARRHANGQGIEDLGLRPEACGDALEGARSLERLRRDLLEGRIRGLFAWGEDVAGDPSLARVVDAATFAVAADWTPTATTRAADLVLPLSALAESEGSVTSMERRVQDLLRAFEPPAGRTGLSILAELAAAAAGGRGPRTLAEVRARLAAAWPAYAPLLDLEAGESFVWGGEDPFAERFPLEGGRGRFAAAPPEPGAAGRRLRYASSLDAWVAALERRLRPGPAASGARERLTA